MKKIWALFLCLLLSVSVLGGCSHSIGSSDNIKIVSTIFPAYDWVREILGDRTDTIELTLLVDDGVDLHSYQPTVEDIVTISSCDMFIYVGGESDVWVEDALAEAQNDNMIVVNLLDVLGDAAKEEEIVEGMQPQRGPSEEESAYDEHVWLSLSNAELYVSDLADQIITLDPEHQDRYCANRDAYLEALRSLDEQYRSVVEASPQNTLLFGDRFPFRYLTDEYHLSYYAAFAGCSAETEASFDTIIFLSSKVDELGIHTVLTLEGSDQRIARTIAQNCKGETPSITAMDSMQSITKADLDSGVTYLSVMEKNLKVLKAALL